MLVQHDLDGTSYGMLSRRQLLRDGVVEVLRQVVDDELRVGELDAVDGDPGTLVPSALWFFCVHRVLDVGHAQERLQLERERRQVGRVGGALELVQHHHVLAGPAPALAALAAPEAEIGRAHV